MTNYVKDVLDNNESKYKAKERRLTIQCVSIVVIFLFCNSFYMIYYILRSQGLLTDQHQLEDQYIHSTARIFAIVNCSVNFVIFMVFNSKFRKTILSTFSQLIGKEEPMPSSSGEGLKLLKIDNSRSKK